ncbi:MAG: Lrp/AsnC family transcriptional regulator [Chloroflexota bacterium]
MDRDHLTLDDLDDLDLSLLQALQANGRVPNARIARALGVSEPTVRKRIERLIRDRFLKVVAVINPVRTPYRVDVVIGVRVRPGSALEMGSALAEMDETVYVGYTAGRYDLIIEVLSRTDEDLFAFLSERLGRLDGIVSTETFHVLRTEKINYDWKLPREFVASEAAAEDRDVGGGSSG